MSDRLAVNEHYLGHLVDAGERRGVEATEDIVSGNGVKLVAKGAAIDARTRERLLQHKLLKPLEACTRVLGGVATRPMDEMARSLIHRHALLADLCSNGHADVIEQAFTSLRLTSPLESLLTLYADQHPRKLEHAVAVSLAAAALMLNVEPSRALQPLLVAGLMHDIGDLYIDPAILASSDALTPEQWRHVAAHPLVAANVLRELPGAGPGVAQAVLHHHERLDGFGYPGALRADAVGLSGQVLGLAEALVGVIDSEPDPGRHAGVMLKLMHGEFDRRLLDRAVRASRPGALDMADEDDAAAQGLLAQAEVLVQQLHGLQRLHDELDQHPCSAPMAGLLAKTQARRTHLSQALSSAGLDLGPQALADELRGAQHAHLRYEIMVVLEELAARLHSLQCELLWRSQALDEGERDALASAVSRHVAPAASAASALSVQAG